MTLGLDVDPAGGAAFYDGLSARRRAVAVSCGAQHLTIAGQGGTVLARWPYRDIRQYDAPEGILRLGCIASPELARLDIGDPALAREIERRCPRLEEETRAGRRAVRRAVLWSIAAAVSVALTAVFLVPLAADRLTPLVPASVERRIGLAVDAQVRRLFGEASCTRPEGRAALATLAAKLNDAARLPVPAEVDVIRSAVPNALALPGGRIYILDGLLQKAENADEVAGVLAHELGHVAHRDGMRRLIQTGGTSFLLGLLFGDVTGAGTLVLATRVLLDSAYSREAETAADRFAADLMTSLGRSPKPMGAFLLRLTGDRHEAMPPFLRSHPVTADRVAALDRQDAAPRGEPLLTGDQWQALKAICRQP